MCKDCVKDGIMTQAQADQQDAAAREGDLLGFLKPILEAVANDVLKDVIVQPEEFADLLARTMATLTALGKTKVGKSTPFGARDELAREIHGILEPGEAAEMLANVSLFLALTEK